MFTTESCVSISALPLETRDNRETQYSHFFKSRQAPEQSIIIGPTEKHAAQTNKCLVLRWADGYAIIL